MSEDEVLEEGAPGKSAGLPGTEGVADTSLTSWLQKGPRLRGTLLFAPPRKRLDCGINYRWYLLCILGKARIGAGTATAPIKLAADSAERASKRRSATTPREGLSQSPTPQTVSNTTTLPPLIPSESHAAEGEGGGGPSSTSRGGGAKVVSWQALPIFFTKIGHLDIRTYMGSAMGHTKLDVRNVVFDGRLYQDSSRRRHGSLGAGVHLCQFTSEQGVVGGEFTLLAGVFARLTILAWLRPAILRHPPQLLPLYTNSPLLHLKMTIRRQPPRLTLALHLSTL